MFVLISNTFLVDAWMTVVTGGVDKLIGVLAGAVLIGESNAAIALLKIGS